MEDSYRRVVESTAARSVSGALINLVLRQIADQKASCRTTQSMTSLV